MAVLKLPRMPDGAAIVNTQNGKPITALTRAWNSAMTQIESSVTDIQAAIDAATGAQADADAAMAAAIAAQADADAAMAAAVAAQATADAAKATADALDAALNVTAGKVLTVLNTMTLAAIDGSTLNIGTGGTLGTAAYTNASDYLPSGASGSFLAKANNLSDVASVPTARTNLGLGTAAVQNTGTSGANVPLLNGANTWSATQIFNSSPVYIGATGALGSTVRVQISAIGGGTEYATAINVASTNNSTRAVEFQIGGSTVGSIVYNSATSVAYNTTSDERLKDFDIPQKDWRPAIDAIKVREFRWKRDGVADFGVAAQQAYPHFPFAFTPPIEPDEMWEADYGKLAALALWGVRDLYKRIDVLETKMYAAGIT